MRASGWLVLVVSLMSVSSPSVGIMVRAPEAVGPPSVDLSGRCPARFQAPGGVGPGAAIPIPALRLGAEVKRGLTSFATGGSGTAAAMEMARRRQAGLPFAPKMFDPAGSARPEVFARGSAQRGESPVYQRLPLKAAANGIASYGLIFAQATSATAGRIVSLQLSLQRAPVARPKVRIVADARPAAIKCPSFQEVDVFAPAMTAARVQRLFVGSGCSWYRLASCARAEWPRGPVLFVQRSGDAYVHRWVDYDRLAAMRFGPERG